METFRAQPVGGTGEHEALRAPKAATVKEIPAKAGDSLAVDQVIVEFEWRVLARLLGKFLKGCVPSQRAELAAQSSDESYIRRFHVTRLARCPTSSTLCSASRDVG